MKSTKRTPRAKRPVFLPLEMPPRVRAVDVEFEWYPGFSIQQQQRSIASLHASAIELGIAIRPLEISTRSTEELGRALSAFNMRIAHPDHGHIPLESAFQSAKVFVDAGPFSELATLDPRKAKRDPRIKGATRLTGFEYAGRKFPSSPTTAFYDWLYIQALVHVDKNLMNQLYERDAFTDIAFNPQRSLNCQARSAALVLSLAKSGESRPWELGFEEFIVIAGYPALLTSLENEQKDPQRRPDSYGTVQDGR